MLMPSPGLCEGGTYENEEEEEEEDEMFGDHLLPRNADRSLLPSPR